MTDSSKWFLLLPSIFVCGSIKVCSQANSHGAKSQERQLLTAKEVNVSPLKKKINELQEVTYAKAVRACVRVVCVCLPRCCCLHETRSWPA